MNIEILKHPEESDWVLCKTAALITTSKTIVNPPDFEWKVKILKANHSPIRVLQFCFRITDISSWVSVHLARHVHATPFVKSQRNDRQSDYDRNAARQDTPVDMMWYMNAEELITIAHKRLCGTVAKETRDVISQICKAVIEVNPEFKELLVPNCIYRGGICNEFKCCGLNKTYKKENI